MLPRFFAPDMDTGLATVTLPVDEARHLTRVLRLSAGDVVEVFDGRGSVCRAVIEAAVRDTALLRLMEALPPVAPPPVRLVLVQAVLKGSSMDDCVRDATMLGVEAVEPLLTAHTDVKPSFACRPETIERWRRVALASVKQSRRASLPVIHQPRTFGDWLATPAAETRLLFVEPSAACRPHALKSLLERGAPARAAVIIGPEGGWSPGEIEAALAAGCVAVSLGPLTLRAESMAIAALSALGVIWQT
ncbi:MAG TPA: RsmE family RNA methyltransferase [Vicinamibacterales bacterium]|nr:RsmE family RNA methyltransferase [Vicinamibacterales bacterium]